VILCNPGLCPGCFACSIMISWLLSKSCTNADVLFQEAVSQLCSQWKKSPRCLIWLSDITSPYTLGLSSSLYFLASCPSLPSTPAMAPTCRAKQEVDTEGNGAQGSPPAGGHCSSSGEESFQFFLFVVWLLWAPLFLWTRELPP
jgi:hypothetical protein